MSLRPCLCLMFNHALPNQLAHHRSVYKDRFSQIRFIQPLQRSPDADVITVYRGCYSFPAYLTDACAKLMEVDCTHFLFVHDDVILSPAIDEANLLEVLEVRSEQEGFTPALASVDYNVGNWQWWPGVLWRWFYPRNVLSGTGVDNLAASLAALPTREFAAERMRRYGINHPPRLILDDQTLTRWRNPEHFPTKSAEDVSNFNRILLEGLFSKTEAGAALEIPYPIAVTGPFSDFCLIPKNALPEVAHIAGVLSAAGVVHEMVLGTAMVLAVETIRLAFEVGVEFEWSDVALDPNVALARMAEFPSLIATHPLKLSGFLDQPQIAQRLRDKSLVDIKARRKHATVRALAPDFDPEAYCSANPDISLSSAYQHYKAHGHAEGRLLRPSG